MNPEKLKRIQQKHPRVSIESLRQVRQMVSYLWPMTVVGNGKNARLVRESLPTGHILKSRDGISEYSVQENGSLRLLKKQTA